MVVGEQAPTARFAAAHAATLDFNSTLIAQLNASSIACGYEKLLDTVQYPQPVGSIKLPLTTAELASSYTLATECDLFDLFYNEALNQNPCFNIYRITDVCPTPTDLIGDGSYFSLTDVQAALHVPNASWTECGNVSLGQYVEPENQSTHPSTL